MSTCSRACLQWTGLHLSTHSSFNSLSRFGSFVKETLEQGYRCESRRILITIFHFHQFRSSTLHGEATNIRNCTQQNTWQLQNVPGIILFLKNTKQYNYLKYISFKIFLFCKCALLPAIVKALKHSWKPFCESRFSSSIAFLIMSLGSQQRQPFSAYFS